MEISELPRDKKIILFDGVCNLCDASVQFIIARDKKDKYRFVALQSELGIKILKHIGINNNLDTIVLYHPGSAYYLKLNAIIEILNSLYIIPFASFFKLFPNYFKNIIYNFIAQNRYKWFGKKESCLFPTSEIKSKFL
jgi:predicted DCC family thiol-disulfide oxidoreductase YuxK